MVIVKGLRNKLQDASASCIKGIAPRNVVATNKKTALSILDNVPQLTCAPSCPIASRCYDIKLLALRPTVLVARAKRHYWLKTNPGAYAAQCIKELRKKDLSNGVRIYGGGDFEPSHVDVLNRIMGEFRSTTFYMISKTIRKYPGCARQLVGNNPNFVLNFSEAKGISFDTKAFNDLKREFPDRVQTVYTLMPEEENFKQALRAAIVFNVSRRKADILRYKEAGLSLCGCDAKDFPSKNACGNCGRCQMWGA